MTSRRGIFARAALAAALSCSFLGCYGSTVLEETSIGNQRALTDFWNKQLFLNMVRASDRAPMYFTAVSTVSETFTNSASVGITPTMHQGGATTFPLTFTGQGGPTVQMGTLDSEKFMKGFMKPIDLQVFKSFYDAGWSRELLLLALFRTVELRMPLVKDATEVDPLVLDRVKKQQARIAAAKEKGEPFEPLVLLEEVVGDKPEDYAKGVQKLYKDLRTAFGWADHTTEDRYEGRLEKDPRPPGAPDNPPFDQQYRTFHRYNTFITKLSEMLERPLTEKGLKAELVFGKEMDNVGPEWTGDEVKKHPNVIAAAQKEGYTLATVVKPADADKKTPEITVYQLQSYSSGLTIRFKGLSDFIDIKGLVKVRSAESLLYHLGENIRYCVENDDKPAIRVHKRTGSDGIPFFLARKRKFAEDSWLSVPYGDDVYIIPKGREAHGETVHLLSLASMLVMLYKSSEGLPTGGVYQLISR